MTREEFLSSGGDLTRQPCYNDRGTAVGWAQEFSSWEPGTWLALSCDGWWTAMPETRYHPWIGRVIGRFCAGKRVDA